MCNQPLTGQNCQLAATSFAKPDDVSSTPEKVLGIHLSRDPDPYGFQNGTFSYGGLGRDSVKQSYSCFPIAIQGPLGNTTYTLLQRNQQYIIVLCQ